MIKILGLKRVIGISALICLNVFVALSLYFYFLPKNQDTEKELRKVRSIVSLKRQDIIRMQDEFERIKEQQVLFEDLQMMGFFDDQDRFKTQKRIEAINQMTDVLRANYEVREAKIEKNDYAEKANHVVLNTSIKIQIESLDDLDFYNFMYWVENAFSGHTSITNVRLSRTTEINDATLRSIGSHRPTALVEGQFEVQWRTMINKDYITKLEGTVFND